MKTESTALARQGKQNAVSRKRADTDLKLSFWFSVVVIMCLFAGFVSTAARLVRDPFSELNPKWGFWGGCNFRLSSYCRIWSSTDCLYLVVSGHQLTLSCLLSRIHRLQTFLVEFLSANQNSLSIRYWYVSLFTPGVLFYRKADTTAK